MSLKPSKNATTNWQQLDQNGQLVMTTEFLLKQKTCCKNYCRNCPYGFHRKIKKGFRMHVYPLRVDFCALDRGGDVYHPRYLNYLDRARVLMFEQGGTTPPELFENGLKWRVKSCSMQFHRQLNWQDHGRVLTEITYVGKSEFSCKQWLVSAATKESVEEASLKEAVFFANTTVELCKLDGSEPVSIPKGVEVILKAHSSN